MPDAYWWITGCVLLILASTAAIDIFTALIPEPPIFFGLLAVVWAQGVGHSWDLSAHHLCQAIAAGVLIWGVNLAWRNIFHVDALGMGDAKWTMLAVDCLGVMPALFAWGIGSCLALAYLAGMRLMHRQFSRVTFAPFLFIGLGLGLFYLRFR